jgi:hypothetical protein
MEYMEYYMRCTTCKKEQWVSLDNPVCKACQLSREDRERWEQIIKRHRAKATPFNLYPEMAIDLNSKDSKARHALVNLSDPEAQAYQTPCDQERIVSRQYERRIIIHDGNSRFFSDTFDIEYNDYNIVAMDMHPLQRFMNDDVQLSLPINCSKILGRRVTHMYNADGSQIKQEQNNRDGTRLYPSYKGKVKATYWVYVILVGNDKRYIHYEFLNVWLQNNVTP